MFKTSKDISRFFEQQMAEYGSLLSKTRKNIKQTAWLRIGIFVLTIIGIYIGTTIGMSWVIGTGLTGFSIFIILAVKHAKLFKTKLWYQTLVEINQTETGLLKGITKGQDEGKEHLREDHPFTFNLDIFGKRSLFQLIDRSATQGGRRALAELLNTPLKDEKRLLQRQQAISELKDKPEWSIFRLPDSFLKKTKRQIKRFLAG
jgi:hypothetical protein